MSKDKPIDPFEGLKQIGEMWEKQLNGLLYMLTDNKEFVGIANIGLEAHSRYMELLRKNQEMLAGLMNIPTKTDVANVAQLSIQTEGKIDNLEEQLWNLQDQITAMKKENVDMFEDSLSVMKQLKAEIPMTLQDIFDTRKINPDFSEIRQAAVEMRILQVNMQELRKELEEIKEIQEQRESQNFHASTILQTELQEVKKGLSLIADLKKEITSLKNMIKKEKDKEKELVHSGVGTAK